MVVFGVLLMIVFTVGGVMDSFFSSQNQNGVDVRKVASTSFGDFTNQDMEDFAEGNRRVADFTFELYRLSKDPAKAKAYPIASLSSSSTEARDRDILSRLVFAEFARDNGIYVGEETINDYFNRLCNNELANQNKTVDQFSRELQRGSLSSVKAHLKTELLARCGQQMISAGVNPQFSQQGFLVGVSPTPVEIWEGHRRLREKFKVQYMTIDIEPTDSISDEPSMEEMKKLYEEGLDRIPNIVMGPGFKEPRKATVAYFAFNNKNFLDAEKEKITEEQIQALYSEWVENEHPNVTEFPKTGTIDGGSFQPGGKKDDDADSANKEDDAAPKLNSPNNTPANENDKKGTPAPETKSSEGKESTPPKAKNEDESKTDKTEPGKKVDESKKKDDAEKKTGSLSTGPQQGQFVSLVQENGTQELADAKKQDGAPKTDSAKQGNQDGTPEKAPANNEKAPGNDKSSPAKQDDGKQESPEKKVDDNSAPAKGDAPSSIPPKAVQDDKEKLKPKIKPLDDKIRELIKEELAQPNASAAIDAAKKKVQAIVSEYLNDYDYYRENPEEADFLDEPDFEAIAGKYGLMFKQFKLVDYQTLSKTDFGKASVLPEDRRQQMRAAAADIFFAKFLNGSSFEVTTTLPSDGIEYMYWVTDKKYREKVSFEDAKPRIIEYYKSVKAIEAAEAKAEKMANEVEADKKTLAAVYGDKVQTSREFGWMEVNQQAEEIARMMPQLLQQNPQMFMPRMGQIFPETPDDAEPVEGVDHGVMSKIFALEENEVGYSTDARKEKVFVFQVIERKSAEAGAKDKFFSEFTFDTSRQNSQLDQGPDLNEILSGMDLLEKYSVKWFGERENE